MASVTDRSPEQFDLGTRGAYPSGGLDSTPPEASSGTLGKLSDWWTRQPLTRFVSASLTRRILLSNLFGLAIFLFGILYLSQHRGWLIDAKRESLRVQGEIIAQAIASNATMEGDRLLLDADKLPALRTLDLSGVPLDAALIEQVKARRPDLDVVTGG